MNCWRRRAAVRHGNGHDLVEVAKERVCGLPPSLSFSLFRCNSYNILARGLPPLVLPSVRGRWPRMEHTNRTSAISPYPLFTDTPCHVFFRGSSPTHSLWTSYASFLEGGLAMAMHQPPAAAALELPTNNGGGERERRRRVS